MPIFKGNQADAILEGAKYSGRAWYSPATNDYYAGGMGDYKHRAAIVSDTDTIAAKIVLDDVLGLARVDYNLDPLLTTVRSDKIVFSVDTLGVVTGSEKDAPLVEPEFASGSQARTNFQLWKNQVLIAFEDSAAKMAAHDLLRMYERDAAREIARMRNSQIATILIAATHTAAGAGNWDTMTTKPYNDYNPFVDIHAGLEALYNTYKNKANNPDL